MCKIIAIINKNKTNTTTLNRLIENNLSGLSREGDGYSIYRHRWGAETKYFIGKNAYENLGENIKYTGESFYILHIRTATAGDKEMGGLHLQPINGFIFAHNGRVLKYDDVKDLNDSHYFIRALLKNHDQPNKKQVEKAIRQDSFYGKGFLFDTKVGVLRVFVNSPANLYVLPDCLIFSTFTLDLNETIQTTREVLGYKWAEKTKTSAIEVLHHQTIDDCYLQFTPDGKLDQWHKIKTGYVSQNQMGFATGYTGYSGPMWGKGRAPDYLKDNEEKREEKRWNELSKKYGVEKAETLTDIIGTDGLVKHDPLGLRDYDL